MTLASAFLLCRVGNFAPPGWQSVQVPVLPFRVVCAVMVVWHAVHERVTPLSHFAVAWQLALLRPLHVPGPGVRLSVKMAEPATPLSAEEWKITLTALSPWRTVPFPAVLWQTLHESPVLP